MLVEHVPIGADAPTVLSIISQGFIGRDWIVDSVDTDSVSASISRSPLSATMRIRFINGALTYEGRALRYETGNPTQRSGPAIRTVRLPPRWIAGLRHDISGVLSAIPDRTP